ncbi:hypothetical protein K3U93_07030 [Mycobacterium malmoense]|uniref:Immunity protein 63 domain-containing protein n=1 Tax=Mycobacterium malmoense TaxID=1780 RepID=A0ABX3STX9_MYCMA|nr:hypothetical protein [Mycobacterium malmoense]OIN82179.1 hypothetical protein BMG05_03760 [Mycobacterium malmoense]ORA83788.1 hypothetical protein BST29_09720 [Mycobacterium malmoense]QZA18902.1 hypothetical protein K3U93_07030 [Mycobacterium malmoense]UNB95671.1 hypothetical protein H5T25_07025 [Mycobacterium malmoense]
MASKFSTDVQTIVGPLLTEHGFVLDEIDDSPDEGGRGQHIVYYRSDDCKIQVYESSREGEVNCMIAPLDVPNEFGLRAKKWQYLTRFAKRPDLPLEELAELARVEYEAYANPLEWVRDRIVKYYEAAHAGILEMYGKG